MTVALDSTLITLDVNKLDQDGYQKIVDRRTNGTTIFLGAIVTGKGQTYPDITLCGEDDPILGHVIKLNTTKHTLPNVSSGNAAFYNDYDNCFANNVYVFVGKMKPGGLYFVLSATNATIAHEDPLKVVDGVLSVASTGDHISFICKNTSGVTGAANTRKYFWAEYVGPI